MKMILTGTGTSHGIPVIGCNCAVCTSKDPKDNRLRCSAWIFDPVSILIDVGPEFRIQALKYKITKPQAVFITHSHADHLHGIDDLRIFSHSTPPTSPVYNKEHEAHIKGLRVYANDRCAKDIAKRFDYIFTPTKEGGGKPKIEIISTKEHEAEFPLSLKNIQVTPVPLMHGSLEDMGLLFTETKKDGTKKSIAYLTDCSFISDKSINLIKERCGVLEHLVIDGLKPTPHSTHFSYEQALEAADRLNAKNTYLTHMAHNLSHKQLSEYIDAVIPKFKNLKRNIEEGGSASPAYDGLILEI
ncbi:MAG: MBL fold metallo-hydrolase [Treponema sp.]|nr:MBL fold metallo-hydrolase [Treponema sp.]